MYTILIRISVGLIFISEGIQKFLFTSTLGIGRFEKIGIPLPHLLSPIVGATEIVCGLLILIGYKIRFASPPLIVIIITAFTVTKLTKITSDGFWEVAHNARTDFAMLLSLLFLFLAPKSGYSIESYL